ncbi:MAG: insulinase family protein [Deltaproteobacteria bacterium]|nr:insulinase family protein [Deltaproteobacteria bacterium]
MRSLRVLAISVAAILFSVLAFAAHADSGIVRTRLDNGLTVVISENRSAPVVSVQMWVKVGGADETDKQAGLSHVFEHMLFKGTAKREVGRIASDIEAVGGDINAYTSFDDTVYHLVVPSKSFGVGLDIIADAVQNSSFDPKELAKELDVILEEIRMNEDDPGRNLYKTLLRAAYKTHPYGRPVIGSEATVKSFDRKSILAFFRKWYVPNNMTLVIAGDVDSKTALQAVKKEFKRFKKGADSHKLRAAEPPQTSLRTVITVKEIKEPHIGLAFHIPAEKNPDTFAIDALAGVLGSGESSRLVKRLKIDKPLVHGISAYPMSMKDSGLFLVTATLDAENTAEALSAIMDEIRRLSASGPSYEELEKIKLNIESDFVYSRETMDGIASQLGYYETIIGDVNYEKTYLEGIRRLTPDDVRRVAAAYLGADNLTVSAVIPQAATNIITPEAVAAALVLKTAPQRAAHSSEQITRVRLENGITVIVKEVRSNPTVAVYGTFPGGLRYETAATNGLGSFTAEMLTRGTLRRTRLEFSRTVEEIAAGMDGFSGWNSTGGSAKFLSRYFDKGMELYADMLLHPSFPDEEITKLKTETLAAIKRQEDYLPGYTFKLLYRELYRSHPYGMPAIGTSETVSAFTREDVLRQYTTFFAPDRFVLIIVGDVDAAYAIDKVRELFNGVNAVSAPLPVPAPEPRQTDVRSTGAVRQKEQTHVGIGFPGVAIGDADSYPLKVMTEVLAGQGGRLFVNLRDMNALAYSVTAFSKEAVDPGIFAVYIATAPDKKDAAMEALMSELKAISIDKVTPEELSRAKGSIIGGYQIGLQEVSSQSAVMANDELYGLGYGFNLEFPKKIEAVTADDVLRVAQKYLTLGAYSISIVGPNGTETAPENGVKNETSTEVKTKTEMKGK